MSETVCILVMLLYCVYLEFKQMKREETFYVKSNEETTPTEAEE